MARYKYHPKCKSVLLSDEFEDHECVAPKPEGAVRCPLCTESVYPSSAEGWRKHIMEVRCPGNPRYARP